MTRLPFLARSRRSTVPLWILSILVVLSVFGCGRSPGRPSLLVVSLDTVRADRLSTYGSARETSPTLSALARQGARFDAAFAQATNTAPSHGSIFTGLYPRQHGSLVNGDRLDPGPPTLAEVLAGAGYETAGFVSGAPMRADVSGLERGFALWDEDFTGARRGGAETVERALAWLDGLQDADGGSFFLFVHLYDAHGPYRPPPPFDRLFRSEEPGPRLGQIPPYQLLRDAEGRVIDRLGPYADRYDGALRFLDERLARLLGAVDLEDTAVVVLSDHGETLAERFHSLDHGGAVHEEQIRIPLVLAAPRMEARGAVVRSPVETVDLVPTLLGLLGVPDPAETVRAGRDLGSLLSGETGSDRAIFAVAEARPIRLRHEGYRLDPHRLVEGVRVGGWKLVRYPGLEEDSFELYHLETDPGERRDLAAERPRERDRLAELLDRWSRLGDHRAPDRSLGPELRRQLESLGYVD